MRSSALKALRIGREEVAYRLVSSKEARRIRLRIGLSGLEVVQPTNRTVSDVEAFLQAQGAWVLAQLRRVERFRGLRRLDPRHLLSISRVGAELVLAPGAVSRTSLASSLERWLRRLAKEEVQRHLVAVTRQLRQYPGRVYIMGQRTKWGNCSSRRNLSFNWRLIMAPPFVLEYVVAHEVVHLLVPDHSKRFWLTLQSVRPSANDARRWLQVHGDKLRVDLDDLCRFAQPRAS